MIVRAYRVEVIDYEDLTLLDTDMVAVVRCLLDGVAIEPLAVRCDDFGDLSVCANVVVPLGNCVTVDLAEHFGGARLLSLRRRAREHVLQAVLDRVLEEPWKAFA